MNNRIKLVSKIKFKFDKKIHKNYFSTQYFIKAKKCLKNSQQISTLQFIHFTDHPIMMCGLNEIKQLLKFFLSKKQQKKIKLFSHLDGQIIDSKDTPLMLIKGHYKDIMCLENIIDGILSQRCSIATNAWLAQQALKAGQKIIYMADRSNNYFCQPYDAYPAYLAGVDLFVTKAQTQFINMDSNVQVVGTIPHALIQQYQNNLIAMVEDYRSYFPNDQLLCLIDYENDVIKTLNSLLPIMDKIDGFRIDTSINLIDKSLVDIATNAYGVNEKLVQLVNDWLVTHQLTNKKICLTSKIDNHFIEKMNQHNLKIDYFGIGSFFLKNSVHVTADLVETNGKLNAKVGRTLLKNHHLLHEIKL